MWNTHWCKGVLAEAYTGGQHDAHQTREQAASGGPWHEYCMGVRTAGETAVARTATRPHRRPVTRDVTPYVSNVLIHAASATAQRVAPSEVPSNFAAPQKMVSQYGPYYRGKSVYGTPPPATPPMTFIKKHWSHAAISTFKSSAA